jgi:hypothetical protein
MRTFHDIINLKKHNFPDIKVCDPQLKKGGVKNHHVYKVCGNDHFGEFEVFRRYNEFYIFRELLCQRYYGLYIPPMPPKKKIVLFYLIIINTISGS